MAGATVSRGELKDKIGFRSCDIVKVIVGSYVTTDVLVNRDLICRSSALAREHLEDPDVKELRLGAIEITLVEVYLNWLYTGTLRTKSTSKQGEFHLLMRLYFFSITLKDVKFGNDIVTAMVEMAQEDSYPRELPGPECINLAYTGFLGISASRAVKLRKTIVEMYARSDPSLFRGIKHSARRSFVTGLCSRAMELRAEGVTSLDGMSTSDFHDCVSKEGDVDGEPAAKRRREAEEPANKRRRADGPRWSSVGRCCMICWSRKWNKASGFFLPDIACILIDVPRSKTSVRWTDLRTLSLILCPPSLWPAFGILVTALALVMPWSNT